MTWGGCLLLASKALVGVNVLLHLTLHLSASCCNARFYPLFPCTPDAWMPWPSLNIIICLLLPQELTRVACLLGLGLIPVHLLSGQRLILSSHGPLASIWPDRVRPCKVHLPLFRVQVPYSGYRYVTGGPRVYFFQRNHSHNQFAPLHDITAACEAVLIKRRLCTTTVRK